MDEEGSQHGVPATSNMNFVWSNIKGLSERTWKTTEFCITTRDSPVVIRLTNMCVHRNRRMLMDAPFLPRFCGRSGDFDFAECWAETCGAGAPPAALDSAISKIDVLPVQPVICHPERSGRNVGAGTQSKGPYALRGSRVFCFPSCPFVPLVVKCV